MMKKICASIESIEKGILLDIVERVASRSFKDFISLRLSSMLFNTLGSEESVYQKVSFEDFPIFSWSVRTREQINERASFMSRCMNAGNKEALYKVGTRQDAVKFIGQMKENLPQRREIKEWRESLINIIDNVWVSNPIFLTQRPDHCCTGEQENRVQVNGWPVDSDEELDDQPCYECACDVEVDHVFDILSKFGL
ncbi:hypothetical protein KY290_027703 [Solanum tuberosum]|uniref:Uncharacterized protein n=1 Tax=Solanum tuberosum TaxID=4113 RepID=A0ABQ7UFT5_SOLTU|nr:hypothetical protein KY289_026890 [Solanum tuberosum]KAH0748471.1 hypothetical protein KY290_027703 [Solanum tuberosum]